MHPWLPSELAETFHLKVLWNLVINCVFLTMDNTAVKVVAYVDDVSIWFRRKFLGVLRNIL